MNKHVLNSIVAAMLPLGAQCAVAQTSGAYGYMDNSNTSKVISASSYSLDEPFRHAQLQTLPTLLLTQRVATDADIMLVKGEQEFANNISTTSELHTIQQNPITELIILDQAVADKQLFYRDLKPGMAIKEIVSTQDGLTQLNQILSQYQNLDALHLVSHADDGVLYLGETQVTEKLLTEQVETLSGINHALKQGADLLFYGCNLAKTAKGEQLLTLIANQADVDVAGSNDITANKAQGGDWELEIVTGDIEASLPFSANALKDFSATLATVPLSSFADGGSTLITTDFTVKGYVEGSSN